MVPWGGMTDTYLGVFLQELCDCHSIVRVAVHPHRQGLETAVQEEGIHG